ncbi:MAG: DUF692 domain-containing protein [Oligoflexia bacterium]|nr:DUF692 domain-containing protein [Oligoflexia bacterium]
MPAVSGVGIGLRRDLADEIIALENSPIRFLECAPENWMGVGGYWGKKLRQAAEHYPFNCHGLSLSLGSPEPLDHIFLQRLKKFFADFPVQIYSEHLSFTKCDNAHTYELLPMPFRSDAVRHVAGRIREVQEILERQIAIENVSYYTPVAPELGEAEFIAAILKEADCKLLLDVNNVFVNAFNHGYDARGFISALPLDRVAYIHMAGHEQRTPDLIIDTHGEPIIDPVYELFEWTIERLHPVPVLLERDYNFPEFPDLLAEVSRLQAIASKVWHQQAAA